MAQYDPFEAGRSISYARRERGWTQEDLAQKIGGGLSQPVVSQLESGNFRRVSKGQLLRISELLGLDDEQLVGAKEHDPKAFAYCKNAACLSQDTYAMGAEVVFKISVIALMSRRTRFCLMCGERLVLACPNCKALPVDGVFCPACGKPFVTFDGDPESLHAEHVIRVADEFRELHRQAMKGIRGAPTV